MITVQHNTKCNKYITEEELKLMPAGTTFLAEWNNIKTRELFIVARPPTGEKIAYCFEETSVFHNKFVTYSQLSSNYLKNIEIVDITISVQRL